MKFTIRSAYVSHFGLPSGLDTNADLEAYIEDVEQEITAVEASWTKYQQEHDVSDSDDALYQDTIDRLKSLKSTAKNRLCTDA
ncbi:hypothetical protein WNY37_16650 [Henriciella sp. AS95]|uniref:hypothetical protein n=1 Tax=Henriciella sp. AS95 TaxID=3135782 RepID=UPI00317DDD52